MLFHARRNGRRPVHRLHARHDADGSRRRGPCRRARSLRFVRDGDARADVQLAQLRKGKTQRLALPPRGVQPRRAAASSRSAWCAASAAGPAGQVVGKDGPTTCAASQATRRSWHRPQPWTRLTQSWSSSSPASRACSRTIRRRSPTTGTQTYLIGEREVAVIDPGPDLPEHLDALEKAIGGRPVAAIMCTHTHRDHSPAARPLAERDRRADHRLRCRSRWRRSDRARMRRSTEIMSPDRVLDDGEAIEVDGKADRRRRDARPHVEPSLLRL